MDAAHLLRPVAAGKVQSRSSEIVGCDAIEAPGASPGHELRHRSRIADAGRKLAADASQSIGLGIGKRLKQHGVNDGEDRGVGSDANRQRGHDDKGEPRLRHEEADREPDVRAQSHGCVIRLQNVLGSSGPPPHAGSARYKMRWTPISR